MPLRAWRPRSRKTFGKNLEIFFIPWRMWRRSLVRRFCHRSQVFKGVHMKVWPQSGDCENTVHRWNLQTEAIKYKRVSSDWPRYKLLGMRREFLRVESSFYRSAATWRAGYKVMACNEAWESLEFQLSDAFGSLPSLYEVCLQWDRPFWD